jgi:hypothetical protein
MKVRMMILVMMIAIWKRSGIGSGGEVKVGELKKDGKCVRNGAR